MPAFAHHFDDLPCAIAVVDDGGIVLDVNAVLADWLGRDASCLIGQAVNVLFSQAGSLLYHTYVMPQLKASGRVEEVALTLRHAQGARVDVLFSAGRHETDGVGVVRCVFVRLRERHQLEHQLLTAQQAADEVPGLLFQLKQDPQGLMAFSYATDAMLVLFDVSPAQAFQSAEVVWRTIHPEDICRVKQTLQDAGATLLPWRCEFRVCLTKGESWREVHATPRREPDGALLWSGYLADVTERKSMEAGLRDKAAAEQANRSKSTFLSRVSHELRTPLNGILGFTRLLQMQDPSNLRVDQLSKLGYIDMAGDSLLRLINEVLDISRIEAGHMQLVMDLVDLDQVIEGAVRLLEPQANQRGTRLVWPQATHFVVRADAHRLGQVLLNLLSNAIKYGPDQGVVTVSVQAMEGRLALSVQDQGPGLNAAQQAQLFQPFNRLGAERSRVDGVGLGLVITRSLVELMGGQLLLVSEVGQGCRFTVQLQQASLPRLTSERAASNKQGEPRGVEVKPIPHRPAWRVLYVEDNALNAVLMHALFEGADDFQLDVVPEGALVLQSAQQWQPDVILMDMHLPDTDGVTLLSTLQHHPGVAQVPCIAVSADAMPEDIDGALAAGFIDYWTKPLDITRVLPSLRQILSTSSVSGGTM